MNDVKLTGYVCNKPEEGRVGADVLASFSLAVRRGDNQPPLFVPVKAKGETARRFLDLGRKGDRVLVNGLLAGSDGLFVHAFSVETIREAAALSVENVATLAELVDLADDTLRAGNPPPEALGKLKIARDCIGKLKESARMKAGKTEVDPQGAQKAHKTAEKHG